jgi:3-hydroxyisobutyrate dehydrogenase
MKIAFLGTGLMGTPMARRAIDAGHDLVVYNRTRAKTEALIAAGARAVDSPRAAIATAEVVIVMVADGAAVRDLLFAQDVGEDVTRPSHRSSTAAGEKVGLAGRVLLQMSTIAPTESRAIAARVHQAGGAYLEAPVLGSIPQASDGSLIVLCGGAEELFER